MIFLCWTIICILVFIFGVITAIILWGRDATLEKYYKKTIKDTLKTSLNEFEYRFSENIPETIIIDSRQRFSTIRTFLKKQIAKILKKEIPPVLVFDIYSDAERKAFVIQKAFSSFIGIQLLDIDFLECLICYKS